MASMSPPPAYSPEAKDDTKVLSQRTAPSRGGAQDAVQEVPQGETSTAGHMGSRSPWKLAMGVIFNSALAEYYSGGPYGSGIK